MSTAYAMSFDSLFKSIGLSSKAGCLIAPADLAKAMMVNIS